MKTTTTRAFTLIEMLLSLSLSAVLLVTVYEYFRGAIHLRDAAAERLVQARLQAHALDRLRGDLFGGRLVGTEFSGDLVGAQSGQNSSRFPGYLRFTTNTGRDTETLSYGDTQEVEYYIDTDPDSTNSQAGALYRTVDRVLLADTRAVTSQEKLLGNVTSMELSFWDGQNETDTWDAEATTDPLPEAVRVTIYRGANADGVTPPPLEVYVPWTMQPPSQSTTTSAAASAPKS